MNLRAENRVLQSHYFSSLKGNAGNLRGHLRARRYFRRGIEQTRALTARRKIFSLEIVVVQRKVRYGVGLPAFRIRQNFKEVLSAGITISAG